MARKRKETRLNHNGHEEHQENFDFFFVFFVLFVVPIHFSRTLRLRAIA
jgi:hypothetical protein